MATISNTTNESINYHIDRLFATVTLVHIIIGTISIVGNGLVMFVAVHQGGGKRLLNYHLVNENCILVCENLFGLPNSNLVGKNICLLQIMW